jgi:hypothetical protein
VLSGSTHECLYVAKEPPQAPVTERDHLEKGTRESLRPYSNGPISELRLWLLNGPEVSHPARSSNYLPDVPALDRL